MPQVIGPVVQAAQAAYSAAVSFVASAPGLVATLGEGGAVLFATAVVNTALSTGASAVAGLALSPKVPTPEFGRQVRRGAIPHRTSGYGRARIGGETMLYEVGSDANAHLVLAQHDGLIDAWETLYLNDQVETVVGGFVQTGPDLRYGKFSDLVQIYTRVGLPTETHYAEADPAIWPTDARGDGIASLIMMAKGKFKEQFLRDYPNGLPIPSQVGRLQLCWDARLGDRGTIEDDGDKLASATWAWTENPVWQLLDYMTNPNAGMGLSISRFLPRIADWVVAADVCDEAVPLKGGGTEPRYRSGGTYLHTNDPADVIATIRQTFDGWIGQDVDGIFTVQAGKYYEPTVIFEERHILSARLDRFKKDEESVNEIVVSYTDATFDYTQVETNPIRDEADINERGVIRPQPLSLPWVQSGPQAQRLGKIQLKRGSAPFSGTVLTTLDGLRAWAERRVRFRMPSEGARFTDFVADIFPVTLNPDLTVTIPFVAWVDDTYEWDAETEQGDGPGGDTRPPPPAVETPEIDDVEVFTDADTTRLRVFPLDAEDGETYIMQWRVTGSTAWTQQSPQIIESGKFESAPVTSADLDIQIALITAGGVQSEWSATFTVNATPGMGQPTNFVALGQVGSAQLSAQAPVHPDVAALLYSRGTTAVFGSASGIWYASCGSGDFVAYTDTVAAGTYYYWVEAYDGLSVGSGPLGPIAVTVT